MAEMEYKELYGSTYNIEESQFLIISTYSLDSVSSGQPSSTQFFLFL